MSSRTNLITDTLDKLLKATEAGKAKWKMEFMGNGFRADMGEAGFVSLFELEGRREEPRNLAITFFGPQRDEVFSISAAPSEAYFETLKKLFFAVRKQFEEGPENLHAFGKYLQSL